MRVNRFYILRDDLTVYCGDVDCLYPSWASTVHRSTATTWVDAAGAAKALAKLHQHNHVCIIAFCDEELCMSAYYEGEVVDIWGDRIVVIFNVDGDLVTQTYKAKQFVGEQTFKKGDGLGVRIQMFRLPTSDEDVESDERKPRKNVVTLPRTF